MLNTGSRRQATREALHKTSQRPGLASPSISALLICVAFALSACGGGRRGALCDDGRYADPRAPVKLQVPEDLDRPVSTENYTIPPPTGDGRRDDAPCSDYPPRLADARQAGEASAGAGAAPGRAPVPRAPDIPVDPLTAEIRGVVAAWAVAWEHRSLETYLAFYSERFVPPGGLTRDAWRAAREQRMSEGAQAVIQLDTLQVSGDRQRANATFSQTFDFEGISSEVVKELELVREREGWRIVREDVIEVR